jgi:hypothetical protein
MTDRARSFDLRQLARALVDAMPAVYNNDRCAAPLRALIAALDEPEAVVLDDDLDAWIAMVDDGTNITPRVDKAVRALVAEVRRLRAVVDERESAIPPLPLQPPVDVEIELEVERIIAEAVRACGDPDGSRATVAVRTSYGDVTVWCRELSGGEFAWEPGPFTRSRLHAAVAKARQGAR